MTEPTPGEFASINIGDEFFCRDGARVMVVGIMQRPLANVDNVKVWQTRNGETIEATIPRAALVSALIHAGARRV